MAVLHADYHHFGLSILNPLKKYNTLLLLSNLRIVIKISAGSVLLLRLTYSLGTTAYLIPQLRCFKKNCFWNGERKMSNKTKKLFNFRAFVSVLAGFSFIFMAVTGLVLFFTPSCRIARETSWIFWGHDKDQWVAVHVLFSIAFVVASLFHIYLNWTALTSYFKTKLQQRFAFRAEWISVLVICSIFYVGTVREVVPFSSLIAWKETFKHSETGTGGQGSASARQTCVRWKANPHRMQNSRAWIHTKGKNTQDNRVDGGRAKGLDRRRSGSSATMRGLTFHGQLSS